MKLRLNAFGLLLALALAACFVLACHKKPTGDARAQTKFAATSFSNSGGLFELIVDVRASRISGPQEFLPLHLVLRNKSKTRLRVSRESFVLETESGVRLPLSTYDEFRKGYRRHRSDLRIGQEFIGTLKARFPTPPFIKRPLEFFPQRDVGPVPRADIQLRQGELAVGLIYFRLPAENSLGELGRCRLLMTPIDAEEQYVVSLEVYHKDKS